MACPADQAPIMGSLWSLGGRGLLARLLLPVDLAVVNRPAQQAVGRQLFDAAAGDFKRVFR